MMNAALLMFLLEDSVTKLMFTVKRLNSHANIYAYIIFRASQLKLLERSLRLNFKEIEFSTLCESRTSQFVSNH